MVPLLAELRIDSSTRDDRRAVRRRLRLELLALSSQDATRVEIHNLSETGLMFQTEAKLAVGETLAVELPDAGSTDARIVWKDGKSFGCEFLDPVPKSAVSAALLRAPIESRNPLVQRPTARALPDQDIFRKGSSRAVEAAATLGLILLLFAAILFIVAMLGFPFSAEQ